jgi:hypothetical protein
MRLQPRNKTGLGRKKLFATLIAFSSILAVPVVQAATVGVNYSLSGGAIFYTASGTASATVTFSVYDIPYTQVVTGTASGATSWNIAGNMGVMVDDAGSITTDPSLQATRRAGTINLNFPVLSLGGLTFIDLSGSVASHDSSMNLVSETGIPLNNTDWLVEQYYGLANGLSASYEGIPIPLVSVPLWPGAPQLLSLTNEPGQSSAVLSAPTGSGSASFLNTTINPGCKLTGILGNCIASVDSIVYDFSGVNFAVTSLDATGSSTTLLPTIVPIPATAWLLGSGLAGLIGVARRKKA